MSAMRLKADIELESILRAATEPKADMKETECMTISVIGWKLDQAARHI